MKPLSEIASTLLSRRATLSSYVPTGQVRQDIGVDGFQEAVRRTWLVPDVESGEVHITNHLGTLAEMKRIAEATPVGPEIGDEVVVAENGQTFQGIVQSKAADGKMKISFGGQKPPQEREYDATEVKMVGKGASPAAAPRATVASTPVSAPAPAAPYTTSAPLRRA